MRLSSAQEINTCENFFNFFVIERYKAFILSGDSAFLSLFFRPCWYFSHSFQWDFYFKVNREFIYFCSRYSHSDFTKFGHWYFVAIKIVLICHKNSFIFLTRYIYPLISANSMFTQVSLNLFWDCLHILNKILMDILYVVEIWDQSTLIDFLPGFCVGRKYFRPIRKCTVSFLLHELSISEFYVAYSPI